MLLNNYFLVQDITNMTSSLNSGSCTILPVSTAENMLQSIHGPKLPSNILAGGLVIGVY